jgi:hypothetical protein
MEEESIHLWQVAMLRADCFIKVANLDYSKSQGTIWNPEEYQKKLGEIRDRAILNGLTARDIDEIFRFAHSIGV